MTYDDLVRTRVVDELVASLDADRIVDLASRLIAVEGHEAHPRYEADVAEAYARELTAAGAEVTVVPVAGDRANVVARVRQGSGGPTLMLNGHLDTVPPYGMSDALRPAVRSGRLYGRGAVDMKGALAAMAETVRVLADPALSMEGELVLTAVAGEENQSAGMLGLVADDSCRADFAVVGEPTGLEVAVAHKGQAWIGVEFTGRSAHGSVPSAGINAVHHAARFVGLVETVLAPALAARSHPLLGAPTINVGVIAGGDRPPTVPGSCQVGLDRRLVPGETREQALAEVVALVDRLHADDPQVSAAVTELPATAGFPHEPLACPTDVPAVRDLCAIAADVRGGRGEPVGVQFWTDGALLAGRTGTPTVICGPGSITQAHSEAEYVDVTQLHQAAGIYLRLAARMLHVAKR